MVAPSDLPTEQALIDWIEAQTRAEEPAYAKGNQGPVYLYQSEGRRFIVKTAPKGGPLGAIRRWMLRREYGAYQRLAGFSGCPRCYGMVGGRYLVMEHIDGPSLRHGRIDDRQKYFDTLLAKIKEMHHLGVAHADLKSRDNLLVVGGHWPCIVDFGTAIVRKPGLAPVNHFLFEFARRLDLNAWVKLKYRGRIWLLMPEDRPYYRRTLVEKVAGALRPFYVWLKRRMS
jgi:predicted Ser/Thr protein kinase